MPSIFSTRLNKTWAMVIFAGLLIIVAAVGYRALANNQTHEMSRRGAPPERVLTVETRTIQPVEGYLSRQLFVGRIEAARESRLGFELDGRVDHVQVDDGQTVKARQIMARLDTDRLNARKRELLAALRETKANLALAQQTLKRTKEALALNAVSRQEFDQARFSERAQEAALGRIKAQIDSIEVDLRKSILRAPFDGVVAKRHIDEGTVVKAGEVIVELLEMGRLEARVGVSVKAAADLQLEQIIPVAVHGQNVTAKIRHILPERDSQTRSVNVILELPPNIADIRQGDLVEVHIEKFVSARGVWLPRNALTEAARGLWALFIAQPQSNPEPGAPIEYRLDRRPIELLYQTEERVFVRGPLERGEKVVISGLHRLVPEMPVRIRRPS